MKKIIFVLFALCSSIAFSQPSVHCVINTTLGKIYVELYPARAPVTVANFMKYVNSNLYDSSSFFRVCTPANEAKRQIKIQVIQGGNVPEGKSFDSIKIETTKQTGLLHKDGTLSMARGGPNSATSSFFICINNQPELDFGGRRNPDGQGFAAFGQVTAGMDVVHKIQAQQDTSQYLVHPVIIYSVRKLAH